MSAILRAFDFETAAVRVIEYATSLGTPVDYLEPVNTDATQRVPTEGGQT